MIATHKHIPILDLKSQYHSIKTEIHAAIDRVLESGAFIMGPDVKLFEQEVAEYLGVKHAIGVNSFSDELVIGLRALGIGDGDEVITTPFSFFATAESISNVGAKPIFVDVDANTFNIDVSKIESQITPRTKAIMPVHLYGRPANMGEIRAIATKYQLKIVEDCAQSFGATYQGKQTGSIGDVGAFSFFPSKNLGAYGDGGLIATNDDRVAELARMLRAHGARKKYHNEIIGYNSRLDTLQAAILRVKLPHIDKWNQGRRRVATAYQELLTNLPGIIAPAVTDGHVFHQYTIRVTDRQRDRVQADLAAQGIGSMVYYPIPQDRLPVYHGLYERNQMSDRLSGEVLSLPIWAEMDISTVEKICLELRRCLA